MSRTLDDLVTDRQRSVSQSDPEIARAIRDEVRRQNVGLELIASENFVSAAVLEAMGSVLTNKYAEGYPGRRYYGGCEFVDIAESLAISRAKALFGAEHANVQPHSGAQANMAAYFALLKPGDTVLGMNLAHGGHLTHGHPLNFSGKLYTIVPYGVRREDERIDHDELVGLARQHQPKMIMVGASAYPRAIDFARIREVATEVGAVMVTDMAHIAGLVAAGIHPSPRPAFGGRHDHDPQDTARTSWRPRAEPHRVRESPRQGALSRRPGRTADAHHCRQGGLFEGSRGAELRRLPASDRGERPASGVYASHERIPSRQWRNRYPPHAGRRLLAGPHRQSGRSRARQSRDHREQECYPVRFKTPRSWRAAFASARQQLPRAACENPEMELIGELISRVLAAPEADHMLSMVRAEVETLCREFPLYPERRA